jgi:regulator of nonsense transcripts 1
VRSNEGVGIGFLTNPRRMNVTITRARFGLIIVGNVRVLSRDSLWNNLLNHFKDHELLMEGTMPHLKLCLLKFRAPQKFIPERRNTSMNDEGEQKNGKLLIIYFRHLKLI